MFVIVPFSVFVIILIVWALLQPGAWRVRFGRVFVLPAGVALCMYVAFQLCVLASNK